ncbi:YciI family protein [Undibacterium rugosum]|uniref:YciI family protein n=1 Tax=Undibacterium rugosum TaxID=2762291 RepID=UPI001B837BC8|nr:YciI family protein [Undibacterium rugosum]MBR7777175.1 hypothetical protein [Undibacterium rugosum]
MRSISLALAGLVLVWTLASSPTAHAQQSATNPQFDAELAKKLGADQRGMRRYVMALLKTGPNKMAAGPERDAMFAGHFANIKKLAAEGLLVTAGPFDGVDGWRGMFIFAVNSIAEAQALTTTDPVIQKGEMVAEYHIHYGTTALMEIPALHQKLTPNLP